MPAPCCSTYGTKLWPTLVRVCCGHLSELQHLTVPLCPCAPAAAPNRGLPCACCTSNANDPQQEPVRPVPQAAARAHLQQHPGQHTGSQQCAASRRDQDTKQQWRWQQLWRQQWWQLAGCSGHQRQLWHQQQDSWHDTATAIQQPTGCSHSSSSRPPDGRSAGQQTCQPTGDDAVKCSGQ
jgi:hypothetical protein